METKEDTVAAEVAENEATEEKAEAEEQATEKEDKKEEVEKESAVLEMAEETIPSKLAGPEAEEEEKTTCRAKFTWQLSDDSTPEHNPEDKGKKIELYYYVFGLQGVDVKTGEKKSYITGWMRHTFTVGDPVIIEFPINRDNRGNIYKDLDFEAATISFYDGIIKDKNGDVVYKNTQYFVSKGGGPSDPIDYDHRFVIQQAMNHDLRFRQADNLKVLDEHKDNINLKFNVKDRKKDTLMKLRNSNVIEDTIKFENGLDTSLVEDSNWDTGFGRALSSGQLYLSHPYTNDKYQVVAEFTGENKQELEKYYTIVVDGNIST